jgi:hypothetical protein
MEHEHEQRDAGEPPAIRGRRDTGGPWATAWAVLALALIGLMIMRACVPSAPVAPSAPPAVTAPSSR